MVMTERYKAKKDMVLLGKEVKKGEILTVDRHDISGMSLIKEDGYLVRIRKQHVEDSLERI